MLDRTEDAQAAQDGGIGHALERMLGLGRQGRLECASQCPGAVCAGGNGGL